MAGTCRRQMARRKPAARAAALGRSVLGRSAALGARRLGARRLGARCLALGGAWALGARRLDGRPGHRMALGAWTVGARCLGARRRCRMALGPGHRMANGTYRRYSGNIGHYDALTEQCDLIGAILVHLTNFHANNVSSFRYNPLTLNIRRITSLSSVRELKSPRVGASRSYRSFGGRFTCWLWALCAIGWR